MRIHRGVDVDKITDAHITEQILELLKQVPEVKRTKATEFIIQEILLRVVLLPK